MFRKSLDQVSLCCLLLWAALLVVPDRAGAQARYAGQLIQAVEYEGMVTLTEDTMNHYLFGRQSEGPPRLDPEELDDRLLKLWSRELIDDIQGQLDGWADLDFENSGQGSSTR